MDKIRWDHTLTGSYYAQYMKSINEIKEVRNTFINRCLFKQGEEAELVEIHSCLDASEWAYAAVVYLRVLYKSGEVEFSFISSKA